MAGILTIRPLDQVMARYGDKLALIGDPAKTHKIIGRAANYEGRKAFVAVKRAVQQQSSIPRAIVQRSMLFLHASTKGGAVETIIRGSGRELSLKVFGARQFKKGVRAKVWGRMQMYEGAFMGPRPGVIAPKLGGHAFHRTSKDRMPIEKSFGPSIPREMVKDESARTFYASTPKIIDRVGKEIAAVLRGY